MQSLRELISLSQEGGLRDESASRTNQEYEIPIDLSQNVRSGTQTRSSQLAFGVEAAAPRKLRRTEDIHSDSSEEDRARARKRRHQINQLSKKKAKDPKISLIGLVHNESVPMYIEGDHYEARGDRRYRQLAAEMPLRTHVNRYQQLYEQGMPELLLRRASLAMHRKYVRSSAAAVDKTADVTASTSSGPDTCFISTKAPEDSHVIGLDALEQLNTCISPMFQQAPYPRLPRYGRGVYSNAACAPSSEVQPASIDALATSPHVHNIRNLWDELYFANMYPEALLALSVLYQVDALNNADIARFFHILRRQLIETKESVKLSSDHCSSSSNRDLDNYSDSRKGTITVEALAFIQRFITDMTDTRSKRFYTKATPSDHARMQALGMSIEILVYAGQPSAALALFDKPSLRADVLVLEYPELVAARTMLYIIQVTYAAQHIQMVCGYRTRKDIIDQINDDASVSSKSHEEDSDVDVNALFRRALSALQGRFTGANYKDSILPTVQDLLRNPWDFSWCVRIVAAIAALPAAQWNPRFERELLQLLGVNNQKALPKNPITAAKRKRDDSDSDSTGSITSSSSESDRQSDKEDDPYSALADQLRQRAAKSLPIQSHKVSINVEAQTRSVDEEGMFAPDDTSTIQITPTACRSLLQELRRAFESAIRQDKHVVGGDIHCLFLAYLHGLADASDRLEARGLHRQAAVHARRLRRPGPAPPAAVMTSPQAHSLRTPLSLATAPPWTATAPLTPSLQAQRYRTFLRYSLEFKVSLSVLQAMERNHSNCQFMQQNDSILSGAMTGSPDQLCNVLRDMCVPGKVCESFALAEIQPVLSKHKDVKEAEALLGHVARWARRECFVQGNAVPAASTMYSSSCSNAAPHLDAVYVMLLLYSMRCTLDVLRRKTNAMQRPLDEIFESDVENSESEKEVSDEEASVDPKEAAVQVPSTSLLPTAAQLVQILCDTLEMPMEHTPQWELLLWSVLAQVMGEIPSEARRETDAPLDESSPLRHLFASEKAAKQEFIEVSNEIEEKSDEEASLNTQETDLSPQKAHVTTPKAVLHSRYWWSRSGPLGALALGSFAKIFISEMDALNCIEMPHSHLQEQDDEDPDRYAAGHLPLDVCIFAASTGALWRHYYALLWEALQVCQHGATAAPLLRRCVVNILPIAPAAGNANLTKSEHSLPSLRDARGQFIRMAASPVPAFSRIYDKISCKPLSRLHAQEALSTAPGGCGPRSYEGTHTVLGGGLLQTLTHRALLSCHLTNNCDNAFLVRAVQMLVLHLYSRVTDTLGQQVSIVARHCLVYLSESGVNIKRALALAQALAGMQPDSAARFLGK